MFKVIYNLPGNGHQETCYNIVTYMHQHLNDNNELCFTMIDVYRSKITVQSCDILTIEVFNP